MVRVEGGGRVMRSIVLVYVGTGVEREGMGVEAKDWEVDGKRELCFTILLSFNVTWCVQANCLLN